MEEIAAAAAENLNRAIVEHSGGNGGQLQAKKPEIIHLTQKRQTRDFFLFQQKRLKSDQKLCDSQRDSKVTFGAQKVTFPALLRLFTKLGGHFGPEKKYLAHPPGPLAPPPSPGDPPPPPGIFQQKTDHPPSLSPRTPPSPPLSRKKNPKRPPRKRSENLF